MRRYFRDYNKTNVFDWVCTSLLYSMKFINVNFVIKFESMLVSGLKEIICFLSRKSNKYFQNGILKYYVVIVITIYPTLFIVYACLICLLFFFRIKQTNEIWWIIKKLGGRVSVGWRFDL